MIFAGGQRIAIKQVGSGSISYCHPDHLGSTSILTNASGVKEEDLVYYPYGETYTNTGTANVVYKYTGKELDDSTGLYFYESRYYDATLGRFIAADTIVPDPTNPQAFNRYSYAFNNPVRYSDPTGHCPVCGPGGYDILINSYGPDPGPAVPAELVTPEVFASPFPQLIIPSVLTPLPQTNPFPQIHNFPSPGSSSAFLNAAIDPAFSQLFPNPGILGPFPAKSSTGIIPELLLGFVPGIDLYQALTSPDPNAVNIFIGALGLAPGGGKTAGTTLNLARRLGQIEEENVARLLNLQHLESILKPGGKLIGEAGSRPGIRELAGDRKAAEDLILDLGKHGEIRNHPKDPGGVQFLLPGGGRLGLRESKSGPAIDLKVPGLDDIDKIHFK